MIYIYTVSNGNIVGYTVDIVDVNPKAFSKIPNAYVLYYFVYAALMVNRLGIINAFIIDIDVYGGLYRGSEPKSTDSAAFLTATVLPFYFSILFVSSWHIIVVLSPFTARDANIPLDINSSTLFPHVQN